METSGNRVQGRSMRRGSTLIEALIAVAVLGIGTAGIAGLITTISGANRRLTFQRRANEVFAQFAAQVSDARCDCVGASCSGADLVRDPRLDPLFAPAYQYPPTNCGAPGASTITMCGDQENWIPAVVGAGPRLHLSYILTDDPGAAAIPGAPPSLNLRVKVREIRYDAAENAADDGYWIREYPLKKACNLRLEPNGRGEFP